MASAREWLAGTRPRTLPAAIVPVMIGTGVAAGYGKFSAWRAALALLVALALQVGVNFANDYSDGIRGTDAVGRRVGPVRLVGWGLASPGRVRAAAFGCFGVACGAGLALAAVTSWWLVLGGAVCVAGAWFYTGGSRPYGYRGLGEVAVFVFFGVFAVAGTAYVQMGSLSWLGLLASLPAGLLSCALLMVNNLRDINSDVTSGKRTLAVRLGDSRSRVVYLAFLLVPFALGVALSPVRPFVLLMLLALPLAIAPMRAVRGGANGPALIATLGQTGRLQLAFGLAFTIGLALHLFPERHRPDSFAPSATWETRAVARALECASKYCGDACRRGNLPLDPWLEKRLASSMLVQPPRRPDGCKGEGVERVEAPRTTGSRDTSHDDAMRFLCELRQLRAEAGLASTELAARAHYPHHVIMAAEAGPSLPDLPVLSAYLRACGAGLADWEERWRSLTGSPAAGHCLPTRPPGCSGLASAGARISAAVPEVQADDQRRIMAAISRAEAAMAAATIPAQPAPAQPPVEATEAAEVCGLEEELETAGTSAASLTDLAVDADAAHGNHEAIDAVAAAATVSTPPAVRSSPASASGFSAGSTPFVPFPRSARSRRSTLPQRAAIAAAVAAVMCVIAAILLVLR